MMKEVFGQEVMTQFMKEVLVEGSEKGGGSHCVGFDCGFCPILWPVAFSIAAVEFGITALLLDTDPNGNTADELNAIANIIANTGHFEEGAAVKLNALCSCRCKCN